ncbi:hypothetical protein ACQPZQ_10660 [Pseudonocardia sp. CA-142604]
MVNPDAGALLGGVGGCREITGGKSVDDAVLAGGAHVVPRAGQRR